MPKEYIVVDIDGTIADLEHRLHHAKYGDYDKFYSLVGEDGNISDVIDIVKILSFHNEIVFYTGRSEICREETNLWLGRRIGYNFQLFMRKEGDHRKDYEVKPELLKEAGLSPDNVLCILEDRNSVVKAFREEGYRVLQVCEGDY